MNEWTDCQQSKMEKQLLHFCTSCGKCSDFSDCCINLYLFFCIYIFFGMFHKCNVRGCASSAKSVVIVFNDRSDVLEKT